MHEYAVIGGGIVGLATAMAVGNKYPKARILVLEKEQDLAQHQTGRNSGVIHSGIYYKPGSLKARFAREGNRSMVEFCSEHGIKHAVCGKVIVASKPSELPLLESLFQRGLDHRLAVTRLSPEQVQETEPHVRCLAGVNVRSTAIVNYREVSAKYVELVKSNGGTVRTGIRVERLRRLNGIQIIETPHGDFEAGFIINCAGLFSDRVARYSGLDPAAKIVPFRGEYYQLVPERRHLVKSLIYPVPDPEFPFLGVHFTNTVHGDVEAGPNAVMAFAREGYEFTRFNARELAETLAYPGVWHMVRRYWRMGSYEMYRSLSKAAFVRALQRLVPDIRAEDVTRGGAGVRAQALARDGSMVDDFRIVDTETAVHVLNAPSPGATASLAIGRHIAGVASDRFGLK